MKDLSFRPTPIHPDDITEEVEAQEVLTFPLTDTEILKIAKDSSKVEQERMAVQAEFDQKKKYYKEKLGGLDSQLTYNFTLIKNESEDRSVKCSFMKNYTKKIGQYIYEGKVMKERPLQDWELTSTKNKVIGSLNSIDNHHVV